jgi:hypothetical protein
MNGRIGRVGEIPEKCISMYLTGTVKILSEGVALEKILSIVTRSVS